MSEPSFFKNQWTHSNPVKIVDDRLESLGKYVHGQHVLLVTTAGFTARGTVEKIKKILATSSVIVWDKVTPNPDIDDLDQVLSILKKIKVDCVVGLGGGSALDTAKVFATSLANNGSQTLAQIFCNGEPNHWDKRLPLVLIPTTAGTGSEVTQFATIWDSKRYKKYSLTGGYVYADLALLDENLTLTLPENETLYTALDTISHALESIWNINITPISRAFSFQALRLSTESLPKLEIHPNNNHARKDLMIASSMAGIAISQTRTAIAHAISYELTIHFKIPHGLACSFTLPYLIEKFVKSKDAHLTKEELNLMDKIQKIISKKIEGKIKKYATKNEILEKVNTENLNLRKDNYSLRSNISIKDILINSLED